MSKEKNQTFMLVLPNRSPVPECNRIRLQCETVQNRKTVYLEIERGGIGNIWKKSVATLRNNYDFPIFRQFPVTMIQWV